MSNAPNDQPLRPGRIRVKEVARQLGLSVSAVRCLRNNPDMGFPAGVKIGTGRTSAVLWDPADVDAWFARRGAMATGAHAGDSTN